MNILTIADRPPRQSILKTIETNQIDLICTLGDLDGVGLRELKIVHDIPKIGIYGNHCSGNYFKGVGIKNMHLQTFEFGGLTFGGFEGSVRYKSGRYAIMFTQEEAIKLMKDFPYVDVMLAHCPPYGINDDTTEVAHTGYKALRQYVEKVNPKYLFHGHTYPPKEDKITKFRETTIIYAYQDEIFTINKAI